MISDAFARVSHKMVILHEIYSVVHRFHIPHACTGHQFICTLHTYVKVAMLSLSFSFQHHTIVTTIHPPTKSTNERYRKNSKSTSVVSYNFEVFANCCLHFTVDLHSFSDSFCCHTLYYFSVA